MKKLFLLCAVCLLVGCKYLPDTPDIPIPPITPPPATNTPPASTCTCDLSKPLCEPDKGQECPVPWGKDVRFLAYSPSKHDDVFIGFNKDSATYRDGKLTGNCFAKNGKQYHYKGQRQKSSSSQMITDRTAEVKETHRVYYDCYKQ